ncbi:MAG TPA: hypothetical protein VGJ82_02445 [Thermoanaerobaculia bacterium]
MRPAKILPMLTLTLTVVVNTYAGGAHCYCKLGPLGSPIHNFGEIEHWSTQIGHDGACRDSCNKKADAFMRDANNRAAACNATHGGTVVSYYAVGTKAYQAGASYNCPQSSPTPTPGSIGFNAPSGSFANVAVYINGTNVDQIQPISGGGIQNNGPFTTFTAHDLLHLHMQSWTFSARLYRDNALVEELVGKSPTISTQQVAITFTGQPNAFVHGHTWKVVTHYAGPGYGDRTKAFFVP